MNGRVFISTMLRSNPAQHMLFTGPTPHDVTWRTELSNACASSPNSATDNYQSLLSVSVSFSLSLSSLPSLL
jgi:hypothetical protein